MSADLVSLVFDAVVIMLLIATIAWAVVLNRKLGALRGSRDELDRMVARLIAATDKAQAGLESLRGAAETSGEALHAKTGAARAAVDELSYLVERGGELARRLEDAISAARRVQPRVSAPDGAAANRAAADPAPAKEPPADGPGPHNERLLKALQGVR